MSASSPELTLGPEDIPGAVISQPYTKHTAAALRWWLLCRGVKVPSSLKKQQLVDRVNAVELEDRPIVDVDGSYLYRKYKSLTESGVQVELPLNPPPPLSGWVVVKEDNYQSIAPSIPPVTSGLLYTYLAGHVGRDGCEGAFRALSRGYTHWASGRLEELRVNTNHPEYCHVQCSMKPSMRAGVYSVYILLGREGSLAKICSATCECAAGKSASCTHVSAILHALCALAPAAFQVQPNHSAANIDEGDDDSVPVTSLLCQWRVPKKRKESALPISQAIFKKHDYAKPAKRKVKLLENFDPRPPEFRGDAANRLPNFLDKVRGEQLGVSLLLDSHFCRSSVEQQISPSIPSTNSLQETVRAFVSSFQVSPEKAREIECNTRQQRLSPLWFDVRRYRITASIFGHVLSRRVDTSPDNLVLRIIQPKKFSTPATRYGIENEQAALERYITYQQTNGHPDITVSPSGFHISPEYPYLGASPDGSVYDASNMQQPFGFLEIKCPYSSRALTPAEACSTPGFCCNFDSSSGNLLLKENHQYYAQIQGQMAIGERPWCDFVIYTNKGVSVQRIAYNEEFWKSKLLPKLTSFYNNCVGPEIVSPLHPLGLPMRDLSKTV